MKRIRTMAEPTPGLAHYLGEAEEPSYDEFRSYRQGDAYQELIDRLTELQRGLCGYCEIDLLGSDRQVEHVAPQHVHPEAALSSGVVASKSSHRHPTVGYSTAAKSAKGTKLLAVGEPANALATVAGFGCHS